MQRSLVATHSNLLFGSALLALLAMAFIAYAPGLHGGFLFDDFINLPNLGAQGRVDNWPTFWRYITSGKADPTGRPLTLLTFLIDARDWPAAAYPFLRTNLILHLIDGVLLFVLLDRLGCSLQKEGHANYRVAALIASALWLLHPLLVSTTLYVVQREAMLPATCVLLGLLIWMRGRTKLVEGHRIEGVSWSVMGLAGFTLLGTLAKANGVLLPVFALLIELVILNPRQPMCLHTPDRLHRWIMAVFAIIPTVMLCSFLTWVGVHGIITGGPPTRPWTYAQRLLTEPRVLLDYLGWLWIPRSASTGLFNDHYLVSTSWLKPIATLPAILAVLALIGGAWHFRRRKPVLALAIGFFFAGQLIESTSIPLELYFEHRNYLPAMLMFWPLGWWLSDRRTLSALKISLSFALPIGLAFITHTRAIAWGNDLTQALVAAKVSPESPRAQANAAQAEMHSSQPELAAHRLEPLLSRWPNDPQISFNLIGARCMMGAVSAADWAAARTAIQKAPNTGALLGNWLDRMLPIALSGTCANLSSADLLDLVKAGLLNPNLSSPGSRQDLTFLRGNIELAQKQPDAALASFQQALDLEVSPGTALKGAAMLGSAGYPVHGQRLLDHYNLVKQMTARPAPGMPRIHEWVLEKQNYWPSEINRIYHQLVVDASKRDSRNASQTDSQNKMH